MWPGQQPPGGEQNPQDQNPQGQHAGGQDQQGQQHNPYQQPGYQQPNPYAQQPGYASPGYPQPGTPQPGYAQQPYAAQQPYGQQPGQQWGTPAVPPGPPQPPRDDARATKITAIVAATAVVVAAGVTGFLVLGGDKDDSAGPGPAKSSAATKSAEPTATDATGGANPRDSDDIKPTIPGWKVVVNPKWGTAFDVPAEWTVKSSGLFIGFEDEKKGDGSALIGMSAPAFLKEKWCITDSDKDGRTEDRELAAAGTKGQNGAKNTEDVARNDSAWWVFGGYTDQKDADKKKLKIGKPESYTTTAGIKGSVATTYSTGVEKTNKCASDGKATTFAFKNSKGDFVSWTFYGAKGVSEEVPDATVKKILSTVRLSGEPEEG
ncbi:hypothetical protein ABT009_09160 [Streptomyces sp. NPDC002896]|uniref:hypothetical protein n=1 Tax=Streptomyces sp. NPDC002896 TaxID=3154438 RepID=UPI00331A42B1